MSGLPEQRPERARNGAVTSGEDIGTALRELLADELSALPPATRQALQRARRTALARASRPRDHVGIGRWMPAGVAAAGLCALFVLTTRGALDPTQDPLTALGPYEWLTSAEAETTAPEMVEDLDFYAWLAARESSG